VRGILLSAKKTEENGKTDKKKEERQV